MEHPEQDGTPRGYAGGPYCGECGESMQLEICLVTGVRHEFMTLYNKPQVVDVDMATTVGSDEEREADRSPENPLVAAFPGTEQGKAKHDEHEHSKQHGKDDVEMPKVTCMGVQSRPVLLTVLGVCSVVFVLYLAAGVLQEWFNVKLQREAEVVDGNATFEVTELTYGVLRMCNTTTNEPEECGKVSFFSERCNTDEADSLMVGSGVLYILSIVLLTGTIIGVCLVSFGASKGHPTKTASLVILVLSGLSTACGIVSPALSMFLFTTSYCSYDMCELLSWTWLRSRPYSSTPTSRSGSCVYGASFYLSWVGAGCSFVASAMLLCLYYLRKETVPIGYKKKKKTGKKETMNDA